MVAKACETSLVGTWKLLSREEVMSGGQRRTDPILGSDPVAYLMYDGSGHFAAQFMRRDRATSTGSDVEGPTPGVPNNSVAANGYDAYFGRYTVGVDGTVTQELVGALSQEDVGKVVTRRCRVNGTELVIDLETTASDGERVTRILRWERVG